MLLPVRAAAAAAAAAAGRSDTDPTASDAALIDPGRPLRTTGQGLFFLEILQGTITA